MKSSRVLDWTSTRADIEKAAIETVILPIGSTEQHGPHLPIGCDTMQAEALSRRIAEKLEKVLLLPPQPYANAIEHAGFTGTVFMRPTTLMQVLEDLVESIRRWQTVKRVVLMNLHGGNFSIKPAVRELNRRNTEPLVIAVDPNRFYPGGAEDLHAGKGETSVMMYLFGKDTYRQADGPDYVPANPNADVLNYVGMREITPDGIWGRPSEASVQYGESVVNEFVDNVVKYINETTDLWRLRKGRDFAS